MQKYDIKKKKKSKRKRLIHEGIFWGGKKPKKFLKKNFTRKTETFTPTN